MNSSKRLSKTSSRSSSSRQSRSTEAYFAKQPVQCRFCHDFILGTRRPLVYCHDCGSVLHPVCAANHVQFGKCVPQQSVDSIPSCLSERPTSMKEWSSDTVREWIAASESHRYFHIFNSKLDALHDDRDIDGSKLLVHPFTSIRDESHRNMLREAVYNSENKFPLESLPAFDGLTERHGHVFSKFNVYCAFSCRRCTLSRGVMSYGVKCCKCGMRFHRMCQYGPLPQCIATNVTPRDTVFGCELSVGYSPYSGNYIPPFLKACTSVIEDRVEKHTEKLKKIYISSVKCSDLKDLMVKMGLDVFDDAKPAPSVSSEHFYSPQLSADAWKSKLEGFCKIAETDNIAGLLKSYLRELPNPVIPFQVYDDMIRLASLPEKPSEVQVNAVVSRMPLEHRYALSHMIKHLAKVFSLVQDLHPSTKLNQFYGAFGTILIRPPTHAVLSIAKWDRPKDLHSSVVKLVYEQRAFHEVNLPSPFPPVNIMPNQPDTSDSSAGYNSDVYIEFNVAHPSIRSPNRVAEYAEMAHSCGKDTMPIILENTDEFASIANLAYFWDNISKHQERQLLKTEAVGNFLLRKSSSDPSALTLVIKAPESNFLVKLVYTVGGGTSGGGMWSISSGSTAFNSISDLIEYYQSNDLPTPARTHTHRPIRLSEPVERELRGDAEQTKQRILDDSTELEYNEGQFETLREKLNECRDKLIPAGEKRLQALEKMKTTLESQLAKLEAAKKLLNTDEQAKLDMSMVVINRQLMNASHEVNRQQEILVNLKNEKNELELKFQQDNITLTQAVQQQTKRRIALELQAGEPVIFEDELTPMQKYNKEFLDQWFYKDMTRAEAQALFDSALQRNPAGLINGTFLVRAAADGGHAVSIWVNKEMKNVRLLYEDRKYGFAYPYVTYSSIVDVIVEYTETPLTMHNAELDTKLTEPIGKVLAAAATGGATDKV